MLSGKLGDFHPTHVDISAVHFTAVVTSSQIGEKLSVRWRAISPIFYSEITT
jgi:hypothetical protein